MFKFRDLSFGKDGNKISYDYKVGKKSQNTKNSNYGNENEIRKLYDLIAEPVAKI